MKRLFIILILIAASNSYSETYVGGTIRSDTTWTSEETWLEHTIYTLAKCLHAVDVDGDGDMDLICNHDNYFDHLFWLENVNSTGLSWIKHNVATNSVISLGAADIDTDGDMDILATLYGDVFWQENMDGVGLLWDIHRIALGDRISSISAADIDGDGDMDILGVSDYTREIFWMENYDSAGLSWVEHTIPASFTIDFMVQVADFDGDGDLDIIGGGDLDILGYGDVAWWENPYGILDTARYKALPAIIYLLLSEGKVVINLEDYVSDYWSNTWTPYSGDSIYGIIKNGNIGLSFEGTSVLVNPSGSYTIDNKTAIAQWFDNTWDNRISTNSNSSINTVWDNDGTPGPSPSDGLFEVISAIDEQGPIAVTYNTYAYYFTYDGLIDWDHNAITLEEYVDHLQAIVNEYNQRIDRLVIYTHGDYGTIWLTEGDNPLTLVTISDSSHHHYTQLTRIKNLLNDNAHILLFPCRSGGGPTGSLFIKKIAELTGATVHANTDFTGTSSNVVADWSLDLVCDATSCWSD